MKKGVITEARRAQFYFRGVLGGAHSGAGHCSRPPFRDRCLDKVTTVLRVLDKAMCSCFGIRDLGKKGTFVP